MTDQMEIQRPQTATPPWEILSNSLALAFGRKYVYDANAFKTFFEVNKKAVYRLTR